MLQLGIEGIQHRGRASGSDKTMLDALIPALNSLQEAIAQGHSITEALTKAVDSAEKGMKDTIPLIAKKGRASYLGDRSKGHQDPGATSSYLMIKALLEANQS